MPTVESCIFWIWAVVLSLKKWEMYSPNKSSSIIISWRFSNQNMLGGMGYPNHPKCSFISHNNDGCNTYGENNASHVKWTLSNELPLVNFVTWVVKHQLHRGPVELSVISLDKVLEKKDWHSELRPTSCTQNTQTLQTKIIWTDLE